MLRSNLLYALLAACAVSCDDGGGGGADGGDTDTADDGGTDTDVDTDTDTEPDGLTVEAVEPEDLSTVPMNQKIHVRFSAGADGDFIDPATVQLLVDGEPVRAWEYFDESVGNREFRFVPIPVWSPSEEHEATILAGAAYAGDPSLVLAEDYTWSFTVDEAPFLEEYDAATTPDLSDDELDAMTAGGDVAFAETDLVKDWEDSSSTLYDISLPVEPVDPDVVAFATKLIASLGPLYAVGIAAPQVGIGRRLFAAAVNGEQRAFINPRLEEWTEDEWYTGSAEGCLSIDGVSSIVERPASISVEFDTPEGDHITGYTLEDYDAKVFLHEYDHLDGILMTDREERRDW
jgi:peptide deformylase